MEPREFDTVSRALSGRQNRRTALKALAVGALAAVGIGGRTAGAYKPQDIVLTIHNRQCRKWMSGTEMYNTCHNKGFGQTLFTFNGTGKRSGLTGNLTYKVPKAGTVAVVQEKRVVNKSKGAFVYCRDTETDKVLFDDKVYDGSIDLALAKGARVVCDWYNVSTQNLNFTPPTSTPAATKTPTPPPCTYTISPSDPGSTLWDAAQALQDNETICLTAGTFTSSAGGATMSIGTGLSGIKIKGAGSGSTKISGGLLSMMSSGVIEGLTIADPPSGSTSQTVIISSSGDPITVALKDVILDGDGPNYAVPLIVGGADVTLTNSAIKNYLLLGVPLVNIADASVSLVNSDITDNDTPLITVWLDQDGSFTMDKDSSITGNKSTIGSVAWITNGSFTNNGGTITNNQSSADDCDNLIGLDNSTCCSNAADGLTGTCTYHP